MATSVELEKFVKFCLANLSGENGHHTFEHICRHIARLRIASNVLPATGPVSAGGDQGRDFETFRTYLPGELPFAIGFLARASSDVIAFACTIQRDNLRSKFERDVAAICTQGTPVDHVVIFAAADVTVRLRHDLQGWAKEEHGVTLDVYDATALSELLSENSLFWIAKQFLQLPSELAPEATDTSATDLPEWYPPLRDYWQTAQRSPVTLGDMLEIRRGLRYALAPGHGRPDLDGWIALMKQLCVQAPFTDVKLQGVYELTVAHHRGKADLRPIENLVRQYVRDILDTEDPTALIDASLVIQMMSTAAVTGLTDVSLSETAEWNAPLRNHIDHLLESPSGPNERAALLQAAAQFGMQLDWTGVEASTSMSLETIDQIHHDLAAAIDSGSVQGHIGTAPLLDVDYAMSSLSKLVEVLPTAPAYPLDGFATLFDLMTPSLRDHPFYRHVCDGIDAAVQRQVGEAAVAERCCQRAISLIGADRPLEALREFHEAKAKWFHGDTLSNSLRAIEAISHIYATLGMHSAAKKYALGLAMLAQKSPDPYDRTFVPKALFSAAISDHNAGAWIASADLMGIAGRAHIAYAPNPFDLDNHDHVLEAAGRQVITAIAAHSLRPEFLDTITEVLEAGPFANLIADRVNDARAEYELWSEQDLFDLLRDDVGPPFSDVGPEHVTAFRALGVDWTIRGANDEETVFAIEDLASTLQILLVEIASDDAVIIPGQVDIEICVATANEEVEESRTRTDGGRRRWLFPLPPHPSEGTLEDFRRNVYEKAFIALHGNSLLDDIHFSSLMNRIAGAGLFNKFEIGHRSYRELAKFRPDAPILLSDHGHRPIDRPESVSAQASSQHLAPRTAPGPGYTVEKAKTILAERYDLLPRPIRFTLPELMREPLLRQLFQELREQDGWKDWHLMSVIMNLTVSHRITARYGPLTEQNWSDYADEFHSEALREELKDDTRVDPSSVTRQSMEMGIVPVALSSLRRWGLDLHHPSTNSASIMQVLATRYGFWDDDIPHGNLFGERMVHE